MLSSIRSCLSPVITCIPARAALESDLPIELMHDWAIREGNRKKPIVEMHKWWARRLGTTFRMLILGALTPANHRRRLGQGDFYRAHDLSDLVVLDPFMGGGTSLIEAAKCGANVIGVDIDPVACFITRKELETVEPERIRQAFCEVEALVAGKIRARYATILPDGTLGTAVYSFWVDIFNCPDCGLEVLGHPHYQLVRNQDTCTQTVICSYCDSIADIPLSWQTHTCPDCSERTFIHRGPVQDGKLHCPDCHTIHPFSTLTSAAALPRRHLFALDVLSEDGRRSLQSATIADRKKYSRVVRIWNRSRHSSTIVPTDEIPAHGRFDNRPLIYGYRRYCDLFNARQLLCLNDIGEALSGLHDRVAREYLAVAFSDCLASNNMFCSFAFDYRKLSPLFSVHSYRRVVRPVENNVWGIGPGRGTFVRCVEKIVRAKEYAQNPFEYRYDGRQPTPVYTGEKIALSFSRPAISRRRGTKAKACILQGSAANLRRLSANTVDLVLSDPPYYNNLPYSELSDFYHVWLKRLLGESYIGRRLAHTPWLQSLFVGRKGADRTVEHNEYAATLGTAFQECARVLKPAGLFVFTYHHGLEKAWQAVAEALAETGFVVTNSFPVRSEGSSGFHSYSGTLKWDAVLVCRLRARRSRRTSLHGLRSFVEARTTKWTRRLGTRLGAADINNLRYALVIQYLSGFRGGLALWPQALGRLNARFLVTNGRPKRLKK